MKINRLLIVSFFTWLTYSILYSIYATYSEVTNEGGFDFWSGLQWFFSLLLISLCASPLMIGLLFFFSKLLTKNIIRKQPTKLIMFTIILLLQIISFDFGYFIINLILNNRFLNLLEDLSLEFKHLFLHLDRNYLILLIYIIVSLVFSNIFCKQNDPRPKN